MYLEKRMFLKDYQLKDELRTQPAVLLKGGSAIIGPDGSYVVEPLFGNEMFIVTEIETDKAVEESSTLDVGGHYARPDVFELIVHRSRRT